VDLGAGGRDVEVVVQPLGRQFHLVVEIVPRTLNHRIERLAVTHPHLPCSRRPSSRSRMLPSSVPRTLVCDEENAAKAAVPRQNPRNGQHGTRSALRDDKGGPSNKRAARPIGPAQFATWPFGSSASSPRVTAATALWICPGHREGHGAPAKFRTPSASFTTKLTKNVRPNSLSRAESGRIASIDPRKLHPGLTVTAPEHTPGSPS
jgi:hypothetical protein